MLNFKKLTIDDIETIKEEKEAKKQLKKKA